MIGESSRRFAGSSVFARAGPEGCRAVVALTPDYDLDDTLPLMAREQVRRVPIVVARTSWSACLLKPTWRLLARTRRPAR